jgi:DNA-binding MarR family transcriptional regulator
MERVMTSATDLGILLGLAYGTFVDELRRALADQGFGDLHRSFGYIARRLDEREASIKELADLLGVTSQGAVKVVDEIQRGGYVRRIADRADGRVRRIQLTPRGRRALASAREFHRTYETDLARRIGAEAEASFRAVLLELVGADASGAVARVIRPM